MPAINFSMLQRWITQYLQQGRVVGQSGTCRPAGSGRQNMRPAWPCALLMLFCTTLHSAWQAPLTADEQSTAASLAVLSIEASLAAGTDASSAHSTTPSSIPRRSDFSASTQPSTFVEDSGASATNALQPGTSPAMQGEQVLLVENRETKNNTLADPRMVEVFVYSYNSGKTYLQIINLDNNETASSQLVNSNHLPLNQNEQNYVKERLSGDSSVLSAVDSEMQRHFSQAVQTLRDVQMKVSIWQPNPSQSDLPPAADCLQQRCAIVSLFTDDYFNFSIEPVVNLNTGQLFTDWQQ